MNSRRLFAAGFIACGLLVFGGTDPEADASPACEHRGAAHVDQHGGMEADKAWHLAHGQRPTCDHDRDKGDKHPEESVHEVPKPDNEQRHDDHHDDHCIGRCNRDHAWWH